MPGIMVGREGDWLKASRILGQAPARIRLALDRAVLQEAQLFRKLTVEGFRTQAPGGKKFKPPSDTTLAIRRFQGFSGTKALIVRGDLRNSIKVVKKTTALGAEAFVGVLRSARGRDGQELINIAETHEFGAGPYVIEMTPAMRQFLAAAFRQELGDFGGPSDGTSSGIIIIRIPARPFLQPVADAEFSGPKAAARFQTRVGANMSGIFGAFGPGGTATAGAIARGIRAARGGPAGRDPSTGRFVSGVPAKLGFRFFR